MKRVIYAAIAIFLLMESACSESGTATILNTANGSWVFKSVTYGEANCRYSSGGILYANSPNGGGSSLTFGFKDTLPTTGGNYTVVTGAPANSRQVIISMDINSGLAAVYDPLPGLNQTMVVSIGQNGKVIVSGSGILLVNNYTPYDTATLNFNVTQLQ